MNIIGVTSAVVLSMSPLLEVRGAIPFAVALGLNIWVAFALALAANIALIPLVFLFLDYAHVHLMKSGILHKPKDLYT